MKPEPWTVGAVWCARALQIALLFALPATSFGSITYVVASASAMSSSPIGSVTITAPAGLVTGDVLVAFVGQNTSTVPIVSAVPAGWTSVLQQNDGASIGVALYSRVTTSADVAGTTTYTWTFQGSARARGLMLDFRGVLSTAPLIATPSTVNGPPVYYPAPSITPGIPNTELVVLFAADNGNGGINVPTGMTSAFVGGTGAGPNGFYIGAFIEPLAASAATG